MNKKINLFYVLAISSMLFLTTGTISMQNTSIQNLGMSSIYAEQSEEGMDILKESVEVKNIPSGQVMNKVGGQEGEELKNQLFGKFDGILSDFKENMTLSKEFCDVMIEWLEKRTGANLSYADFQRCPQLSLDPIVITPIIDLKCPTANVKLHCSEVDYEDHPMIRDLCEELPETLNCSEVDYEDNPIMETLCEQLETFPDSFTPFLELVWDEELQKCVSPIPGTIVDDETAVCPLPLRQEWNGEQCVFK